MSGLEEIRDRQALLRHMENKALPPTLSNGTMMVMDKFYYSPMTSIPNSASGMDVLLFK